MYVILDVIRGPLKGRSFLFDRPDTFVVGRSRAVHLAMPEDFALSRDHFLIEFMPPRCELRDLGSTNGTYLNDQRVDRARLKSGDRIAAGQSLFLVRFEDASSQGNGFHAGPPKTVARSLILPETDEGPVLSPIASIRCTGCGQIAPQGIDIARDSLDQGESIQWICDNCRVEAAASPQVVPHYTTLRELGRGAMGVVYLAQNADNGRKVALKLIAPETAAARSAIERFLREMNVVSRLKHPHIVEYLEQGVHRGRFWFAMEYVDGTNVEQLASKSPGHYPIAQACRLTCQVLKGLEHAHREGFVHRDIKPENILVGRSARGLTAKISDFGLAKSYRSIGLSGLTFSGEMRGTIPFMPPEQMLEFKKVQPSGDLYSTAATLYYLIAGDYIYDQPADGGGDLIRMLLEEQPIPIRERRDSVPEELDAILERCLSREPEARFPDAGSLRAALVPFC